MVYVELLVSCTNLPNLDLGTATDPLCVLFIRQFGQWKEFARTESIQDTLSPQFTETFLIDYDVDVPQQLRFSVYDIDNRSSNLHGHDFVGTTDVWLSELVEVNTNQKSVSISLRIKGETKPRGQIHITAVVVVETMSCLALHMGGHKVVKRNKLTVKKPACILEVCRCLGDDNFHPVYRTEISDQTYYPRWRPFTVNIQKLCNGDWDQPIQFICRHYSSNSYSYKILGHHRTTLRELLQKRNCDNDPMLLLTHPNRERKKDDTNDVLKVFSCKVDMNYSFLDYIRGGCQLKIMLAIDFTASNGALDEEMSLHNITDIQKNQYLNAIDNLVSPLLRYNRNADVQVCGFGAKFKGQSCVEHCFPLMQNTSTVKGIQGIKDAYMSCVKDLTFAGPTKFSPILLQAIETAEQFGLTQETQTYLVQFIITDAVLNDLDDVIVCVERTHSLPMSVIIANVGPSEIPVSDHLLLTPQRSEGYERGHSRTKTPKLHFLKFRRGTVNDAGIREMLASVSVHLTQFMQISQIEPNGSGLKRSNKSWPDDLCKLADDSTAMCNLSPQKQNINRRATLPARLEAPVCPTCGSHLKS